jgi:hypothetical protein
MSTIYGRHKWALYYILNNKASNSSNFYSFRAKHELRGMYNFCSRIQDMKYQKGGRKNKRPGCGEIKVA